VVPTHEKSALRRATEHLKSAVFAWPAAVDAPVPNHAMEYCFEQLGRRFLLAPCSFRGSGRSLRGGLHEMTGYRNAQVCEI